MPRPDKVENPNNKKNLTFAYPVELEDFILDSYWYLYGDKSIENPNKVQKETTARTAIINLVISQVRAAEMRKADDARNDAEEAMRELEEQVKPYITIEEQV